LVTWRGQIRNPNIDPPAAGKSPKPIVCPAGYGGQANPNYQNENAQNPAGLPGLCGWPLYPPPADKSGAYWRVALAFWLIGGYFNKFSNKSQQKNGQKN